MTEKGKKKLVVVGGSDQEQEPTEEEKESAREAEERRRNRSIGLVNLLKQGPYEIEMTVPLTGSEDAKFHCIAPWEQPLYVAANTQEGQALAAYMAQFSIDCTIHDGKLFMAGMAEWNLPSAVYSDDLSLKEQAEAAFKKFHDELPDRIGEKVNACLTILRKALGPRIKLPTAEDHRRFGGQL